MPKADKRAATKEIPTFGKRISESVVKEQLSFERTLRTGYLCGLPSGDLCEVSNDFKLCTCELFKEQSSCAHIKIVKDIYTNKGAKYRYLVWSAFHKSIRLNMVEAAGTWLRVLQIISRPDQIRKYVENLLLEDSRGFHLKEESRNGLALEMLVEKAARLRKKWNLEYLNKEKAFDSWVRGFANADLVQPISLSGLDSLEQAYRLNWHIRKNKSLEPAFWDLIRNTDRTASDEIIKRVLNVYKNGSYARGLILEILSGVWSDEAFELDLYLPITKPMHIPHFYHWVDDIHTWSGFGKIKSLGARYGDLSFSQFDLDLRASGMVAGVGFRHRAVAQGRSTYGNKLCDWSDVQLDKDDWRSWLLMDVSFYPKLQNISTQNHP